MRTVIFVGMILIATAINNDILKNVGEFTAYVLIAAITLDIIYLINDIKSKN